MSVATNSHPEYGFDLGLDNGAVSSALAVIQLDSQVELVRHLNSQRLRAAFESAFAAANTAAALDMLSVALDRRCVGA